MMINDVHDFYMCKIGEEGDFELREAYEKLCEYGALKDKYKILETKRLTHTLAFLENFKTK